MSLRLVGYRFSVYTWAVRMGLAEAGLAAEYVEANPFAPDGVELLHRQHPFGRVPVLWDGEFRLYETGAILGYLLPPSGDRRLVARERQVGGIADSYAYWPLVRQVFSGAVFRPALGEDPDMGAIAKGLSAAPAVLAGLDEIAAEGLVLTGRRPGAADCHLAPMIGYFAMAREGRAILADYPALSAWFSTMSQRDSYVRTMPDLGELKGTT